MPRKSKLKGRKRKQRKVKKATRNWLELPSDIMMNILHRVGVVDILKNAQKVCTAWHEICKDPAMWRVIYMDDCSMDSVGTAVYKKICKHAVDRSQGQLVDLTLTCFCDYELLQYVADRSSQLRRLEIVHYLGGWYEIRSEPFKKLSLLEELSLVRTEVQVEYIEAIGRYCPLLKTLKLNRIPLSYRVYITAVGYDKYLIRQNEMARAIGKYLPELTHLELIENDMENSGLQAILDGCSHLESLDLRKCVSLDLDGDLGKRCSQQIKYLKLPYHLLDGYLSNYDILDASDDGSDDSTSDDDDYISCSDDDSDGDMWAGIGFGCNS